MAGQALINPGSAIFITLGLGNFATGGAIGTAATTVDLYTAIQVAQTTAGQTVTLPSPTDATAGRWILFTNTGSQAVTLLGASIAAGASTSAIWNGAAWTKIG